MLKKICDSPQTSCKILKRRHKVSKNVLWHALGRETFSHWDSEHVHLLYTLSIVSNVREFNFLLQWHESIMSGLMSMVIIEHTTQDEIGSLLLHTRTDPWNEAHHIACMSCLWQRARKREISFSSFLVDSESVIASVFDQSHWMNSQDQILLQFLGRTCLHFSRFAWHVHSKAASEKFSLCSTVPLEKKFSPFSTRFYMGIKLWILETCLLVQMFQHPRIEPMKQIWAKRMWFRFIQNTKRPGFCRFTLEEGMMVNSIHHANDARFIYAGRNKNKQSIFFFKMYCSVRQEKKAAPHNSNWIIFVSSFASMGLRQIYWICC